MKNLSELFENQFFLMDIGVTQSVQLNGKAVEVGRYAAFSPNKGQKGHQAVEVSNDHRYLCEKYHIRTDCVCVLNGEELIQNG